MCTECEKPIQGCVGVGVDVTQTGVLYGWDTTGGVVGTCRSRPTRVCKVRSRGTFYVFGCNQSTIVEYPIG